MRLKKVHRPSTYRLHSYHTLYANTTEMPTAYFRLPYCFPLQLYSVSRRRAKTYNLTTEMHRPFPTIQFHGHSFSLLLKS
jgi:hypothetical protein